MLAPCVLLVGVAQDFEGGLGRDELVVALAVLLNDAPACAFDSGGILAAEQTQSVSERPAFDVYVITALAALFPLAVDF